MSFKNIDFDNDCVAWICHFGKEMRNRYIIDGFYKTTNLIYENVKDNKKAGIYEDDLIYPFLHLIRHTYELQLKAIMDAIVSFSQSYGIMGIDINGFNNYKYSHNLLDIYNFVLNNIYKLDSRLFNILHVAIDTIRAKIDDFIPEADIDPYRYATDRSDNENLKDLNQVSFDEAKTDAEQFINCSDYVMSELEKLNDEYSLGTYFRNFSRYDIFQIAIKLPKYSFWKKEMFVLTKEQIMKEYGLTSNAFSFVVDIIKNHREFSYYIQYNRKDYSNECSLIEKCFAFNKNMNPNYNEDTCLNASFDFETIQSYGSRCEEFISRLSNNEMIQVLTYYYMGHDLKRSEQYDDCVMTIKEIDDPNEPYSLKSYFRSKLTSWGFIGCVLDGIRRAGDFELFLKLYDFCKDADITDLEEWAQEYLRLKSFLDE